MIVRVTPGAGMEQLLKDLQSLGNTGIAVAKKHLAAWAPGIVPRQQALAPVDVEDGGQLRDSIRFEGPFVKGAFVGVRFIVGGDVLLPYLGNRTENVYAIVQETDTTLRHLHGQANFMSDPVIDGAPKLFEGIGADLSREAARASG